MILNFHSMFFQLLFIHLFRPFLKYTSASSPLPSNVSPRKMCTAAASSISKLLRLYKRTYGLRQICNIAVYIAHSACTIHLLNLPDKDAKRDISYGLKHLSEIAEGWLCARRTLAILGMQVRKWKIDLPEEATIILEQTESKFGGQRMTEESSPKPSIVSNGVMPPPQPVALPYTSNQAEPIQQYFIPQTQAPSQIVSAQPQTSPRYSASFPQVDVMTTQPQQPAPQQSRNQASTQTAEQRRESLSRLFGGIDSLLDDSKEWWLRDQSAIFDNWNRQDSSPSFSDVRFDATNGRASSDSSISVQNGGFDYMNFNLGPLGGQPPMPNYDASYASGSMY